jgi:hypothetical protein
MKARRSEGTGMWFLNSPIFIAWSALEDHQNYYALLSFGAPGAGKSVLLYVFPRAPTNMTMLIIVAAQRCLDAYAMLSAE